MAADSKKPPPGAFGPPPSKRPAAPKTDGAVPQKAPVTPSAPIKPVGKTNFDGAVPIAPSAKPPVKPAAPAPTAGPTMGPAAIPRPPIAPAQKPVPPAPKPVAPVSKSVTPTAAPKQSATPQSAVPTAKPVDARSSQPVAPVSKPVQPAGPQTARPAPPLIPIAKQPAAPAAKQSAPPATKSPIAAVGPATPAARQSNATEVPRKPPIAAAIQPAVDEPTTVTELDDELNLAEPLEPLPVRAPPRRSAPPIGMATDDQKPQAANSFATWVRSRPKWFWVVIVGVLCIAGAIWELTSGMKSGGRQFQYEPERLKMLREQHPDAQPEAADGHMPDRSPNGPASDRYVPTPAK